MEFVFVVKRFELFPRAQPQGFTRLPPEDIEAFLQRVEERGFFVERRHAERDATMKQIIPYVVLVRGGDVFRMERIGGGEGRLHGKASVGVGGHVNPVDAEHPVKAGMQRELDEEVDLGGLQVEPHAVGLINDDGTDVGSVHVGLVCIAQVPDGATVAVRETDQLRGSFVPLTELVDECRDDRGRFETWSAFVIDALPLLLEPRG